MLAAVSFAIKYLPLIVAAVTFVQNFADSKTPGAERKALAVSFVVSTLTKLGVTVNPRTTTVIEWLIDLAVDVLNRFGIFAHEEGADPKAAAVVKPEAAPLVVTPAVAPISGDEIRLRELEEALNRG